MAVTLTPRVGYELDAAGQIGVQHKNWDRADYVAGRIYTTSAAGIPPVANLYDGCVVVEKDTGISYRLFAADSYAVKKYVNYPFVYRAFGVLNGFGAGSPGPWKWDQVDTAKCVNYVPAWKDASGGIKVQVKGLYLVAQHIHLSPQSGTLGGALATGLCRNGVHSANEETNLLIGSGWNSPTAPVGMGIHQRWNVGDVIQPYIYNSTGLIVNVITTVECTLLRPVW